MARQKGIIKITGTLDGLNFYSRLGVPLIRKAGGGFQSEAIKTKPSMVRVRENGSEFKICMTSVKHFKIGLQPITNQFKDTFLHQRLVQLFTKIKLLDTVSARGQRTVGIGLENEAGKNLLNRYVLTSGNSLDAVLRQGFEVDWSLSGFRIAAFDVAAVRFPKGVTHVQLQTGYMVFDFTTFTPVFTKSASMTLSKAAATAPLELGISALPIGAGTKIVVVYLQFMQEVNGTMCLMKELKTRGLEVVYVD
jgi:hypothetical protein